jgi:hypothetical protein
MAQASRSAGHGVLDIIDEPVPVRVDTSKLGSGFEMIEQGIKEKAPGVVEASGIDPARVEVALEWLDDTAFSYFIDVSVVPKHEGTDSIGQRETCRNCTTDEIINKTLEHLAAVLSTAREQDEEFEQAAVEEEVIDEPPIVQPPIEKERRGSIGPLGWAGVGLLATGVATAVTGAVFLGLGERQAANFPTKLRDYRPPGIALVVTGGVALVTGAVLLGLGVRRSRNVQVDVGFGPGSGSAMLTGRF